MSKLFTRLLRRAAAAALLCFSAATAYADSNGYVYVNLASNYSNYPVVENADYFNDFRLVETSPGSKIYEGVVSLNYGRFRCYTELADLPDGASPSVSQYMNLIMPAGADWQFPVKKLGNSDVYFTDNVLVANTIPKNENVADWQVPAGEYFIHLDLNTKRLYLIRSSHRLALINTNVAPTFDTLDKFSSLENLKEYVEAGDLNVRFYDLANRQWINPPVGQEVVAGSPLDIYDFEKSETMGQPVTWPGWSGGMVAGLSNYAVSFDCDDITKMWRPIDASTVCAVGDFCSWSFGTCLSATPVDNEVTFTLPAGAKEFKFTLGASWDAAPLGSLDVKETQADNSTILYLSQSGMAGNVTLSEALAQDADITVSLAEGTVHFPAGVSVVGNEKSQLNADKDEYYVEIAGETVPWSGASAAVRNSCANLTKNSDGTYSNYVYGLKGKAFRIVSKLAPKGGNNNVIAPAAGIEKTLRFATGNAQSSASNLTADNAGWWRIPDYYDSFISLLVTVTPGANPVVSLTNENDPSITPAQIYLIGSPNGWDINDSSMPLLKKADGNYYGEYEITSNDLFRFYRSIGSWETGSLGSQDIDAPLDCSIASGQYTGSWVEGKGCWTFPDWAGGKMYMCVKASGQVHFSDSPIQEGDPTETNGYWVYSNNKYYQMKEKADGVFSVSVFVDSGFRLFSKSLGLTEDEPQWSGSYALSAPSADFCFSVDEFGIGEATYTHQNDLNTKGGNMFRVPEDVTSATIVLDTNVGKVYIETGDIYSHNYLVGKVSDNVLPTFENYEQFKDLHISSSGGIVDIPAGKFDFSILRKGFLDMKLNTEIENIEFDDMVAAAPDMWYGWDGKRVVCDGWTGGKVFVSTHRCVDLRTIDQIYVSDIVGDTEKFTGLKRIGTDGLLFEGDVDFDENTPSQGFSILVNKSVAPTYFSIGISGIRKNVNNQYAVFTPKDFVDGTMKVNFVCTQYRDQIKIEPLKGKGKIHIKVDLLDGTLQMSLPKANLGEFIESYADGSADLNGIVGTPSNSREDAFVWSGTVKNPSAEGYDLSFISANGNVIRPVADGITNVTFNEDGLWTGNFTTVGSPDKATAVTTAASSAKWHIAPEAATKGLVALIDNKTGKITIHSSSSMKGYFITPNYDPRIDEFEQVSENMLRETAPGVYEGEFVVEEDGETSRYFQRNLYDNNPSFSRDCISTSDGMNTVRLVSADDVVEKPVFYNGNYLFLYDYWRFQAYAGQIHVRYDEPAAKMTFTWKTSGVDNVSADASGLHIIPGTGCAYVTAVAPALVEFYSVSGIKVASQQVEAGTTVVTLPAGLYIANGAKLIVR